MIFNNSCIVHKNQRVTPKLTRLIMSLFMSVALCAAVSTVSYAGQQSQSLQTGQLLTSEIHKTIGHGQKTTQFRELPQLAHGGGWHGGGGRHWHGGGGPNWHGGAGWNGGAGWHGRGWNRNMNNWMFYSGVIPAAAIILSNTGGRRVYSCSANIDGMYYNGRFYDGACHIFINGNDYSTTRFRINTR